MVFDETGLLRLSLVKEKKVPTDIIDTNGPQHFIASQQHISIIHLSLMP